MVQDQARMPDEIGSGTLVEIFDHHFILSAGHCINSYERKNCSFGIKKDPHFFMPERWPSKYVYQKDDGKDFGYIQIPRHEKAIFDSGNRIFLGIDRIQATNAEELKTEADLMILAGYPGATQHEDSGLGIYYFRLFTLTTVIEGTKINQDKNAPVGRAKKSHSFAGYIDLYVPKSGIYLDDNESEKEIPKLAGASGGGCWNTNIRRLKKNWKSSDIKLTGIHVGSTHETDDNNWFARENLIGNHLRLIAEDFPTIRDKIYQRWPFLKESSWAI